MKSKVLKPTDCLIGYSIPHNKNSFYKNFYSGKDIDFTKQFVWVSYNLDTVIPGRPIMNYLKHLGVNIKYEFTFMDFSDFFKSAKFKCLVLFSHWNNNQIEFYDGLQDLSLIIESIPQESNLILDLNVCKCDLLPKLLEIKRKDVTVKSNKDRYCFPIFWLRYYKYFFQYLYDYNVDFNEANYYCITSFFKNLEK